VIERQIEEAIVQTFTITDADLHQIMLNLPESKCQTYRPFLVQAMINCEISTPRRSVTLNRELSVGWILLANSSNKELMRFIQSNLKSLQDQLVVNLFCERLRL
jgi:hypothetical protein